MKRTRTAASKQERNQNYSSTESMSDEERSSLPQKYKYDSILTIPPHVSFWRRSEHLGVLGLFYEENSVDSLDVLLNKSLSYDAISHIHHLNPVLNPVVRLLDRVIYFDANEYDPNAEDTWTSDMNVINQCHDNVLKTTFNEVMANYIQEIPQEATEIYENKITLERMLLNVWSGIHAFYNTLKYFMVDIYKKKRQKGGCSETVYTELHRDFFKTCGLIFRSGEATKKIMKIGKFQVSSQPALRCSFENVIARQLLGENVLTIGEVKKTQPNNLKLTPDNLIDVLESYSILGQHGGELLLEINDSTFRRTASSPCKLAYGAIIIGTQIVFTALEMDEEHLEAIASFDELVNEVQNVGDSKIFYTKPYDILKASDRSELYVSLLRLTCYQYNLKIIND